MKLRLKRLTSQQVFNGLEMLADGEVEASEVMRWAMVDAEGELELQDERGKPLDNTVVRYDHSLPTLDERRWSLEYQGGIWRGVRLWLAVL